jgi:hypothetical protein
MLLTISNIYKCNVIVVKSIKDIFFSGTPVSAKATLTKYNTSSQKKIYMMLLFPAKFLPLHAKDSLTSVFLPYLIPLTQLMDFHNIWY